MHIPKCTIIPSHSLHLNDTLWRFVHIHAGVSSAANALPLDGLACLQTLQFV